MPSQKSNKIIVEVANKHFRPTEVELLIGDASKANKKLDWYPKYDLKALCDDMVAADIKLFQQKQLLQKAGFEIKNEYE